MEGSATSITDHEGNSKTFNYDYSFWSHDQFEEEEDGYNKPVDGKYADQKSVYEAIGSSILTNAWYLLGYVGRVITAVFLPMARPDQARVTP